MLLHRDVPAARVCLRLDVVGGMDADTNRLLGSQQQLDWYVVHSCRVECVSRETNMLNKNNRPQVFDNWIRHLRPRQLVLHGCSLYTSRLDNQRLWLRPPPDLTNQPPGHILHGQEHWRAALLQKVPSTEARPRAPLLNMQTLRAQNGPPLPLASHLRRPAKLQGISAVSDIYNAAMLLRLCI